MSELLNIWPYIEAARILKKKKRKGFGNMFRHQMETFAILLDYGYDDPVLLKAALIHDLLEDGIKFMDISADDIVKIDSDGESVASVVEEVSQQVNNGIEEPKQDFLLRIMESGSLQAKTLKLADRLSNISSLCSTNNPEFIHKYLKETKDFILPYAKDINIEMYTELESIVREYKSF